MGLPSTVDPSFVRLVKVYQSAKIEFPHLKPITLAQWAKESGWGKSNLASKFNNFAGAKWRTYMKPYATSVKYAAWDGSSQYCYFASLPDFIGGYWARFDLEPAYMGWRDHTKTPNDFLSFIGPIWLGMGVDAGIAYVRDVTRIEEQWKFTDDFRSAENETEYVDLATLRRRFNTGDDPGWM